MCVPLFLCLLSLSELGTMRKKNNHRPIIVSHVTMSLLFLFLLLSSVVVESQSDVDALAMMALKASFGSSSESLGWSDLNPCKWDRVVCSDDNRVTRIQIGHRSLQGSLPPELRNLTGLERLELQWNNISGPLPSLAGLASLQVLMLSNNRFSSIPGDFFSGMTSLQSVEIDDNPFSPWTIPESLESASSIQNFSANSANLTGKFPDVFGPENFPSLSLLHLAFNCLEGELPASLAGSQIQSLWLNGQESLGKLSGDIRVIGNMTMLREAWLHSNAFSGPLPDFSSLNGLESLSLRDNLFTGPIPLSLSGSESLKAVNLSNNLFQGPMPAFKPGISVDMSKDSNGFCRPVPGRCDPRVETLLSIAGDMGFPRRFAENWPGNDPCSGGWIGITCDASGNIIIVNFQKMGISGAISPEFGSIKSLKRLVLAGNNLTGTIPDSISTLPALAELDVSNNSLHGKVPSFRNNVAVKTNGNPDIGKDKIGTLPGPAGEAIPSITTDRPGDEKKRSSSSPRLAGVIVISVLAGAFVIALIAILFFCVCRARQKRNLSRVQSPNATVIHPRHSGSDTEGVKITVAGSTVSLAGASTGESHHLSLTGSGSGSNNIQMIESGNMVISIQVLRNVTNNFSQDNILGQGGFGTVYKGELHDGTKIAVKRMESGVIAGKGLSEFKSEIAVLTKVRHRHLVALLGYCLDGFEKLLVYEYMPQGTLSSHLFNWAHEGLEPMGWTRRLSVALDVARGVEYLHGLAHQSFIHRDLKPSNILLGDDMRAKVADFGLVRLAPEGKASVETRIAGTFGYLAPEYAVTGRVTTKVDVFSFGVILMELITGRKALDETQPEESMHLVTWFRRMSINKDTFRKAVDPMLDLLDSDTAASVATVAELAGHCCAREPYQRPDMGHAVNVLSSLAELWKPAEQTPDDIYGIDLDMSLPQALKKWQAYEGRSHLENSSSSLLPSLDNTQTSIPTRPYGFAESFTSADGR